MSKKKTFNLIIIMNRNFKTILWLLALLISLAVLSGCQTKNKSLNIQKDQTSEKSEVKKAEESKTVDLSKTETKKQERAAEKSKSNYTFKADSIKKDAKGNTTIFGFQGSGDIEKSLNTEKSEKVNQDNNINNSNSSKIDSSGEKKADHKSKVQEKQVKESISGKAYGIAFLILVVLVAVWYIKKQVKPVKVVVKEAEDLFL